MPRVLRGPACPAARVRGGSWRCRARLPNKLYTTCRPAPLANGARYLLLYPFGADAWGIIVLGVFVYWLLLWFIEAIEPDEYMTTEEREMGPGELFYVALISMTGAHSIEASTDYMRIIQVGWIFLIFLLSLPAFIQQCLCLLWHCLVQPNTYVCLL